MRDQGRRRRKRRYGADQHRPRDRWMRRFSSSISRLRRKQPAARPGIPQKLGKERWKPRPKPRQVSWTVSHPVLVMAVLVASLSSLGLPFFAGTFATDGSLEPGWIPPDEGSSWGVHCTVRGARPKMLRPYSGGLRPGLSESKAKQSAFLSSLRAGPPFEVACRGLFRCSNTFSCQQTFNVYILQVRKLRRYPF